MLLTTMEAIRALNKSIMQKVITRYLQYACLYQHCICHKRMKINIILLFFNVNISLAISIFRDHYYALKLIIMNF